MRGVSPKISLKHKFYCVLKIFPFGIGYWKHVWHFYIVRHTIRKTFDLFREKLNTIVYTNVMYFKSQTIIRGLDRVFVITCALIYCRIYTLGKILRKICLFLQNFEKNYVFFLKMSNFFLNMGELFAHVEKNANF